VLIAVLEDFSAFQIAISKNKKIQRQKITHYSTDADALLLHSAPKIFTLSYAKGNLKVKIVLLDIIHNNFSSGRLQ